MTKQPITVKSSSFDRQKNGFGVECYINEEDEASPSSSSHTSPRSLARSLAEAGCNAPLSSPDQQLSPMQPAFLTTIVEGDGDNESSISSAVDNRSAVDNPEDDEVETMKNNGLKRWWHVMGTKKNYAESDAGSMAASSTLGILEAQSVTSNGGSDGSAVKKHGLDEKRIAEKDDFADDITADTSVEGRKNKGVAPVDTMVDIDLGSPGESRSTSKVASGAGEKGLKGKMKSRFCAFLLVMLLVVAAASIGIAFLVKNNKSSDNNGSGNVSKNSVGDGGSDGGSNTDRAPTFKPLTTSPTSAPVFGTPENTGDENGSGASVKTDPSISTQTASPTASFSPSPSWTYSPSPSSTPILTEAPTNKPTVSPSSSPTASPTESPSALPTAKQIIPTAQPSSSPTSEYLDVLERAAALDTLRAISETDVTQLSDTDPQFQAALWLMEKDEANLKVELNPPDVRQVDRETVSQDRYAQRYILAVTYFALNGEGWAANNAGDPFIVRQRRTKYEDRKMPEKAKPHRRILADSDTESKHPFLSQTHECNWEFVVCEKVVVGTDDNGNKISSNVVTAIVIPGADSDGENLVPGRDVRGTLPGKELGKLKYLKEITMNHNSLSGPLPTELTALKDLYWIDLTGNDLTGNIPDFGVGLQYLYLGGNKFIGNLPAFDGTGNYELTHLWAHDNDLTGSIPDTLGSLKELTMLLLYGNDLDSELPDTMSMLSSLTWLDIAYNQLSGSLPDGFYDVTSLQNAYLNHNGFYGEVRSKVKNLLQLEELWLDNNSFSGAIPPAFRFLYKLESLQLHNNFFTGEVPLEICQVRDNNLLFDLTVNCDADTHQEWVDYVECACCNESECK